MEHKHKLGLYVSYYLSRFDKVAYENLGFGNQVETHAKIGELLSVNPQTVKNWRDEFDPLFGYRAGWHQRPMSPSRVRVVQALEGLDEQQVYEIVKDILFKNLNSDSDELEQLLNIVSTDDQIKKNTSFILRAPTGSAAEKIFIEYYTENLRPIEGNLIDCRDFGVGYDFKIEGINSTSYVEVKGISEFSGGILFTDKEWRIAKSEKNNYYLCIISNLNSQPNIIFIQNPASKLKPIKNVYATLQINWSVSKTQLF